MAFLFQADLDKIQADNPIPQDALGLPADPVDPAPPALPVATPKSKGMMSLLALWPQKAPETSSSPGFHHRPAREVQEAVRAEQVIEELKRVKDEKVRAEQALQAAQESPGSIKKPEIKVYGKMQQVRRGGRTAGTRRTGKAAGFKSNKRQLGAPVLRRDPSAQEKLVMIKFVEDKMKDGFVNKPQLISSASKRQFEVIHGNP